MWKLGLLPLLKFHTPDDDRLFSVMIRDRKRMLEFSYPRDVHARDQPEAINNGEPDHGSFGDQGGLG